jgi:hypothetical protein
VEFQILQNIMVSRKLWYLKQSFLHASQTKTIPRDGARDNASAQPCRVKGGCPLSHRRGVGLMAAAMETGGVTRGGVSNGVLCRG